MWSDLCIEMVFTILFWVDFQTLLQCRLTCKTISEVTTNHFFWQNRVQRIYPLFPSFVPHFDPNLGFLWLQYSELETFYDNFEKFNAVTGKINQNSKAQPTLEGLQFTNINLEK